VLAIIVAVYLCVRIVMVSGNIPVRNISARSTGRGLDGTVINGALGIRRGMRIDYAEITNAVVRLSGADGVAGASVRKKPNGDIAILVQPIKIIAIWTNGADCFPVSDTGDVLGKKIPECPENTVLFAGNIPPQMPEFLSALKSVPKIYANTSRAEWVDGRRWNLSINETIVKLPEYNTDAALDKLSDMSGRWSVFDRNLSVIDLRNPEHALGVIGVK